MAATRTSSRQASLKAKEAILGSGDKKGKATAGAKRKQVTAQGPEPKREKKDDKEQKEEEAKKEQISQEQKEEDQEDKMVEDQEEEKKEKEKREEAGKAEEEPKEEPPKEEARAEEPPTEEEQKKPEEKPSDREPETKPSGETGSGVRESQEREDIVPSNLLEKGIIYFFYRPRVNLEEAHSVNDVSRSFMVLRPTPRGAELSQGSVAPGATCRLMILPKKKFPTSGKERDMGFVEKAGVSVKELQDSFIAGDQYQTATRGERTRPDAKPYAEGVYAITSTKRASHLAYILTIPSEIGEIQQDFGLRERGSWVVQSKNPKYAGPPNAQLPKNPEYPEHVLEKFQDLRWIPLEPELIDYPNAQFLMIGEAQDDLGKAATAEPGGKQPHEEQPGEELEKLEEENEERVDSLSGDHTVYQDLGLDAENYPKVPSTWTDQ